MNSSVIFLGTILAGLLGCSLPSFSQSQSHFLSDAAASAILQSGMTGGVEAYNDCSPRLTADSTLLPGTIDERLTALKEQAPSLTWSSRDTTYNVAVGTRPNNFFLGVNVPAISVDSENIGLAAAEILGQAAVSKNIEETHVELFSTPPGFAALKTQGGEKAAPLLLPPESVADDLNQLASHWKSRVWLLNVGDCSGRLTGRILWIEK